MSSQSAREHLERRGYADRIRTPEAATATVEEAAEALGVEPGRIAKTLSFITPDGPILILAEGNARIDNRKFKDVFHTKAKMIPADSVEELTGHAPGGVCPFGVKDGVCVYFDESLHKYDVVYPAAGADHTAVELAVSELEDAVGGGSWIDVTKDHTEP